MKRFLLSFLVVSMLAVVLPAPLSAQSQNEVITTVLYDGTDTPGGRFGDSGGSAAPTGTAPEVHTAGFDEGPNNLVVRTHDQFAIRVDWNINEDETTGAFLTTVLPDFAEWTTDDTGGYSGCITTAFPDPQTAVCEVGDQPEGSNGAIRMTALMNEALDNTTFDVVSTLTTDDDTTGVFDGLDQDLTVSEAPFVDYIKNAPIVEEVDNGDYVALFPLSFNDHSQGQSLVGVGPINDAIPVLLADHMWNLTPSARLATAEQMAEAGFAGLPCGDYDADNGGPFVVGNGTWTCGDEDDSGPYNIVPITVENFASRPAPTTLADTSANATVAPQISAGQIAIYLTQAEVEAAVADVNNADSEIAALFENALVDAVAAGGPATITSADEIVDATGNGTSGGTNNGAPGNNNAELAFGDIPEDEGGPGTTIFVSHDLRWYPGPLQLGSIETYDNPYVGFDEVVLGLLPGQTTRNHWNNDGTEEHIGEVSRGQVLTIEATTSGTSSNEPIDIGLHQCVALDTSHYNLIDLPGEIPVREHLFSSDPIGFRSEAPSNGVAHLTAGQMIATMQRGLRNSGEPNIDPYTNFAGGDTEPWPYVVEVTNAALPTVGGQTGISEDGLTCDADDAGSAGWVASTDDLSAFDADDDGR